MYKIIGADGKEYGPITAEQVRQWIAEGRANAQTKVLPPGATDWRPLAEFPDLLGAIPITPLTPPAFQPDLSAAREKVSGPAIGLIITAILSLLGTAAGMVWNLVAPQYSFRQPGMTPEMERIAQMFSGTAGIISGLLGFIIAGLILYGGLKMKKCESYGWAMTASILALIPCNCPCCFIGIPIGIWALVVLSKPEVKNAFS